MHKQTQAQKHTQAHPHTQTLISTNTQNIRKHTLPKLCVMVSTGLTAEVAKSLILCILTSVGIFGSGIPPNISLQMESDQFLILIRGNPL